MLRVIRTTSTLLIVVLITFFGTQALGSLYLDKMKISGTGESKFVNGLVSSNSDSSQQKKIILSNLKQVPFNTIQVGTFVERERANQLVQEIAKKGLYPQIVYDEGKYKVWLGCFQKTETAHVVKDELLKLGYEAFVTRSITNRYFFQFNNEVFDKSTLAPLIRDYSVTLEKCIVLYQDINFNYYNSEIFLPKFSILQQEISNIVENTENIITLSQAKSYKNDLLLLAEQAEAWRQSLNNLTNSWQSDTFQLSQKECLGVISQYNIFLSKYKNDV